MRAGLSAAGVLLAACAAAPAASGWLTSHKQAVAESKKTGKPILANFTGSDWCGWCVKLGNEVFKTAEFKKWARDNVVLLYLDFPQRKRLSSALRRQNDDLRRKYSITGFPTILFFTADGTVIGRSGYRAGGPDAWTAAAQPIVDKAPKPEKLQLAGSLAEATKLAAEKKRPLLVLGAYGKSPAAFRALVEDSDFARFSNARLVTVQVDTSATATADGKALAALREKYKLRKSPTQAFAADVAAGKLLYATYGNVRASSLTDALVKALPKPAYEGNWLEDFDEAKRLAAALQRPILMDFSGSDWCGWCIKLDKEVFSTADFKKLAREKLVLMRVDLPRSKKLPAGTLQQNRRLAQQFGVRGFPTLVLVDALASEKGRLGGFPRGGFGQLRGWISSTMRK